MEGEERIFRMSLKLRRSSSSGKICTRSEDERVRFEDAPPLEDAKVADGSDMVESLRQLSDR